MLVLSPRLSRYLKIVNLIGVLMVVGIHSKPPNPVIPGSLENWLYEFSCNGLFRSAVPLLFMVSGILYFRDVTVFAQKYWTKLRSRLRSLVIPYLLYTTTIFVARISYQTLTNHLPALNENPNNDAILSWEQLLQIWFSAPGHLWFLRDLIVLIIISPVIYLIAQSWILIIIMLMIWILDWQLFPFLATVPVLNQESLAFFSLGAYWARSGLPKIQGYHYILYWILTGGWLSLFIIRFGLSPVSNLNPYSNQFDHPLALVCYKLSVLVGIILIWQTAQCLENYSRLMEISQYSFVLYLIHTPLTVFIGKVISMSGVEGVMLFLLRFLITLVMSLGGIYFLKIRLPFVYGLLSGGRLPDQSLKLSP